MKTGKDIKQALTIRGKIRLNKILLKICLLLNKRQNMKKKIRKTKDFGLAFLRHGLKETFSELYNEFLTFVEKNDEEGARIFLINNLQKFPKEMQDKLTFAFFEEALMDETKGVKDIAEIQKQGLDAISQIDKAKKILAEKIKIEDLRSSLTK